MVNRALLIGINYFGTEAELGGCINDVTNIKAVLTSQYKFEESNMRILTDDSKEHMPTYKNIISGCHWLIDTANPGDNLFLHYSGHGSFIKDTSGDETDGCDECLCPCDYETSGFIVDDLLSSLLSKVPTGAKLTCLMDCCHSGTNIDLRYNYVQAKSGIAISKDKQYKNTNGSIIAFSGCKDSETSADTSEINSMTKLKQRQGAMTYAFIETLKNAEYDLTYKTLLSRIRKTLANKGYTQVPQMASGTYLNLTDKFSI